jgi:hypothetical protein
MMQQKEARKSTHACFLKKLPFWCEFPILVAVYAFCGFGIIELLLITANRCGRAKLSFVLFDLINTHFI